MTLKSILKHRSIETTFVSTRQPRGRHGGKLESNTPKGGKLAKTCPLEIRFWFVVRYVTTCEFNAYAIRTLKCYVTRKKTSINAKKENIQDNIPIYIYTLHTRTTNKNKEILLADARETTSASSRPAAIHVADREREGIE